MSYSVVISYGNIAELYRYEREPHGKGRATARLFDPGFSSSRTLARPSVQSSKVRTKSNARRAVVAFRRLVGANLGLCDYPIFATLTYRENMEVLRQGRKDFNAFARRAAREFGSGFRYICVPEFQERGAVHFHALFWGLPPGTFESERDTRLVARLWARGFVDLISTDGSQALAGYLAKYMQKAHLDPRLSGAKAYIASRNVLRPRVDKGAILSEYFCGVCSPDLSTAALLHESTYLTQYLGQAIYQRYETK